MLLSAFAASAAIADINGDGVMDVAKNSGLQNPTRVSVSYNRPPNPVPFDLFQVASTQAPYFVSAGDLNNDNRLDLVVSDDGADHYHLNNGNDGLGQVIWPTRTSRSPGRRDDGFASQSLILTWTRTASGTC